MLLANLCKNQSLLSFIDTDLHTVAGTLCFAGLTTMVNAGDRDCGAINYPKGGVAR